MSEGEPRDGHGEARAPGLRDRKKLEASATLVSVAKRLFAERGFEAVTVDEIASAANVSRRTFFRYFPTKEDVFFGRRRAQLASLEAELSMKPKRGEAPFDCVRRSLLAVARLHVESKAEILAEHHILAGSPVLLAGDLEWDRRAFELLAATLGREGCDPKRARLAAGAVIGALRVVIESWVSSGGRGDLLAEGAEALDLLAPLAPPRPSVQK